MSPNYQSLATFKISFSTSVYHWWFATINQLSIQWKIKIPTTASGGFLMFMIPRQITRYRHNPIVASDWVS